MTRMRDIAWDTCLLEPRRDPAFERRFRRETGMPGRIASYFAGNPWLEDATIAFNIETSRHLAIDRELAGLIGMIVSQDNSCRFCFAETRAMLRILGMPERRISQLEQDLLTEDFDTRASAALEFARRFSRSNPPVDQRDLEKLGAAGFDELQILEIARIAGLYVYFNRVTTLLALPPHGIEKLPDRWYIRLFRPLIAFAITRTAVHARGEPLGQAEREGTFSEVVLAFARLPFARSLRATLDGMWASPVLAKRTKALVVAVVARALGCPFAEREATEILLEEGLQTQQVEEILAHLSSAELDPTERVAISFARETVWYEPVRIQQLGRGAMRALSREEFVELVATASIANMVCRLGTVVGAS